MITREQVSTLNGFDVYGTDDSKIGSVGQVWNDGNGQPTWASVKTGLFGLNESLIPLQQADLRDDRLVLPFDKDKVKHAPNIDASHDEPLTGSDVERLYDYYGLNWRSGGQPAAAANDYQAGAANGYATGGAAAGNANYGGASADYTSTDYATTNNVGTDYATTNSSGTDYADAGQAGYDSSYAGNTPPSYAGNGPVRSADRSDVDDQDVAVGRARLTRHAVNGQFGRVEVEPVDDTDSRSV